MLPKVENHCIKLQTSTRPISTPTCHATSCPSEQELWTPHLLLGRFGVQEYPASNTFRHFSLPTEVLMWPFQPSPGSTKTTTSRTQMEPVIDLPEGSEYGSLRTEFFSCAHVRSSPMLLSPLSEAHDTTLSLSSWKRSRLVRDLISLCSLESSVNILTWLWFTTSPSAGREAGPVVHR